MNVNDLAKFLNASVRVGLEIYYESYREMKLGQVGTKLDSVNLSNTRGIGIRAIHDGKVGFAYTTDLRDKSITESISKAVANMEISESIDIELPYDDTPTVSENWSNQKLNGFTERLGGDILNELTKSTQIEDPGYHSTVKNANLTVAQRNVAVVNSNGIRREFAANYFNVSATITVANKMVNCTAFQSLLSRDIEKFEPGEFGKSVASKGMALVGGIPTSSGITTIVLNPQAASQLLGALTMIFKSDLKSFGSSFRFGEKIASDFVSITDDPLKSDVIGSGPFDGEGIVGHRKCLIKSGQLVGHIHNTESARRAGLAKSTGNAARYSYSEVPAVGTSVVTLEPSETSPQDMMKEVQNGIYIMELRGVSSGLDFNKGKFSIPFRGRKIENGALGHPVANMTISGYLLDFLQKIDGVGNDLWYRGPIGSPTLRLREVRVNGK